MLISPVIFFAAIVAFTIAAGVIEAIARRRNRAAIARLAGEWGMSYAAGDPFRLTPRVVELLPLQGAAHVRLFDLMYCSKGEDCYRYIVTAEFTAGVVRSKKRVRQVMAITERRKSDQRSTEPVYAMTVSDPNLPILEQYRSLAPERAANPAVGH